MKHFARNRFHAEQIEGMFSVSFVLILLQLEFRAD